MIVDQDGEAKRSLFVDMVRTSLIVSKRKNSGDPYALMNAVWTIGALTRVSLRIPAHLSASEAANEYMISQWDEFEAFRAEPDYVPPKWTGEMSPEVIRARLASGVTEELIDGVWQKQNPDWMDLPGDDSNTLKLLAHIRDHGAATMSDLMVVLPHLNRRSIGRLVKASEAEDGLIEMTGAGRGVIWSATKALLRLRSASRKIDPVKKEKSSEPQKRKLDPLEKKVLSLIQRHGAVSNAEIRKVAPHLLNHQVRRLLQRMRDAGLIHVHGASKSSVWRLVEAEGPRTFP